MQGDPASLGRKVIKHYQEGGDPRAFHVAADALGTSSHPKAPLVTRLLRGLGKFTEQAMSRMENHPVFVTAGRILDKIEGHPLAEKADKLVDEISEHPVFEALGKAADKIEGHPLAEKADKLVDRFFGGK